MQTVFIATHRRGFESDPVMDELRRRNVPVFRFNSDAAQHASKTSIKIGPSRSSVTFACDGRSVEAEDIGIGWFQQPPPYQGQPCDNYAALQQQNLFAAQFGAFELIEAPWLNAPRAVLHGGNKIIQLHTAQKVGLPLMRTLISNDSNAIIPFAYDNETIAKNLATPWIDVGSRTVAAYTKIVRNEWLESTDELEFCPIIYQQYCRRRRDYRVIVVGNNIFSASCTPGNEQQEDVRRSDVTGEHYFPCAFDSDLTEKLFRFMKELEIDYCAADFMEDDDGIYFLEANICGAWWWVDRYYQGKICNAIVDYFVSKL